MDTDVHFSSNLVAFLLEREMIQTTFFRENQNTPFVFDNFFFSKILPFEERRKILYSRTVHMWQYDKFTLHAGHLRLQNTLRICNTYFLFRQ